MSSDLSAVALPDSPAKDFHAHLDACRQCRNQPFDLCPIGTRLANEAWSRITEILKTSLSGSRRGEE